MSMLIMHVRCAQGDRRWEELMKKMGHAIGQQIKDA
jgi:hypothetical protein